MDDMVAGPQVSAASVSSCTIADPYKVSVSPANQVIVSGTWTDQVERVTIDGKNVLKRTVLVDRPQRARADPDPAAVARLRPRPHRGQILGCVRCVEGDLEHARATVRELVDEVQQAGSWLDSPEDDDEALGPNRVGDGRGSSARDRLGHPPSIRIAGPAMSTHPDGAPGQRGILSRFVAVPLTGPSVEHMIPCIPDRPAQRMDSARFMPGIAPRLS